MFEASPDIYSILSRPYILLILAFILDLFIGDPGWLPHPVRAMGWLIKKIEDILRGNIRKKERIEKLSGLFLVITVVVLTYVPFYILNSLLLFPSSSSTINFLTILMMIYLISTTIAVKGLTDSARLVIKYVNDRNLKEARKRVSHIVGRDTEKLDERGILKATIESLAENASDGIIAPIFYFVIGGLPLAMTYKAINTMDSMLGYKNDKYRYFGWAAARLDDIANYIPARITGVLIVISSFLIAIFKNPVYALRITHHALHIMLSDGRKHPSPNSGIPEAAMAGALGVRLGGPATYGGILVEKPYIGIDRKAETWSSSISGNLYLLRASEESVSIIMLTSILGLITAAGIMRIIV